MNQTDTQFWDERRGIIRSKKGGWITGEKVICHGYSLLEELVGNITYFQLLMLNATGRVPGEKLAKWLEASYMCLSWPDPRVWCNQVGALAGTIKTSPVAAITAGILASDSSMYGPGVAHIVTNVISEAKTKFDQGESIENIIGVYARRPGVKPIIPGFNRPVLSGDERVTAMEQVTEGLGFDRGGYLSLAYKIESYLYDNYHESMNIAMFIVAFLLDQKYSAREIYRLTSIMVNSGVTACYAESCDNPPDSFLPLRCDDIEYTGVKAREVPER